MRADDVRAAVAPALAALGLDVFDVEVTPQAVRVVVERDGGVDLDTITAATEAVMRAVDAGGVDRRRYALEVSSPGLERTLRTPAHFVRALGTTVSVKAHHDGGERARYRGTLIAADDDGITVQVDDAPLRLPYVAVTAARTVFEWGPTPPPGHAAKQRASRQRAASKKKVAR